MFKFNNDYSETAHERILNAIVSTCGVQHETNGEDLICDEAISLIRKTIACDNADVHFLSGGTMANMVVISHVLKPYEAVISTDAGHVATHETGAIEFTGHKVYVVPHENGKLTVNSIDRAYRAHDSEHMVKPTLVYISNTTELGSVYLKEEISDIYNYCKSKNMYLYIDGARLGAALASGASDLKFEDLPNICDFFTIGGAKNGAIAGEAIVIVNDKAKEYFRYNMKQKGAFFCKGFVLGAQFREFFKDGLYLELAKHAYEMSMKLSVGIEKCGYKFLLKPESNLLFPIFPNRVIEILREDYGFYDTEIIDNEHTAVRLVCSWATPETKINEFIEKLKGIS